MDYGYRKTGTNSENVKRSGLFLWKRIVEEKERGKDGKRKCQEIENMSTKKLKGVIVVIQRYLLGICALHCCKNSRTTNLLF